MKKTVIVGGGIPSLAIASKMASDAKKKNTDVEITILERENEIGGLYKSIDYVEHGLFDHGMHLLYDTCVPEIDEVIHSFLPENEWIKLGDNEKDIAGIFFQGRLQTYSPYMDLRHVEKTLYSQAVGDFFWNFKNRVKEDFTNAETYLESRFGHALAQKFFRPTLEKLYRTPMEQLDFFATKLTGLDRVILFDPSEMTDLMKSDFLRSHLAYADQHELPHVRQNNQKALYPKKFGMQNLIHAIGEKLKNQNVRVITGAAVNSVEIKNELLNAVQYTKGTENTKIEGIDRIFWGSGIPPLAQQLGIPMTGPRPAVKQIIYLNILFDRPVSMDRLYYFYCYEKSNLTFRVTNYENYCPSAASSRGHPVCIEIWPEEKISDEQCFKKALEELIGFGVITTEHRVLFKKTETSAGGFPIPSLSNISTIDSLRDQVQSKKIRNLKVIGGMAEKNSYFIPDVLRDAFSKLND